jgi:leader peptidase (prepilin peptidase) / N-methyltransferase
VLGAGLMFGLYFLLAVAKPGGMGFGDVKLAGLLGLYLGFAGWSALAVGAFAAFLLGGVVGLALIAGRLASRRSAIPFGPFMLAGAACGLAFGAPVTGWYLAVAGV